MKETVEGLFLPNVYTANDVMPEIDFRILEWSFKFSFPWLAPCVFESQKELHHWKIGPPSWPFCGVASIVVASIYPKMLVAADTHNSHYFNFAPGNNRATQTKNRINTGWYSDYCEIDLTRDQFTRYTPVISSVCRPENMPFLLAVIEENFVKLAQRTIRYFCKYHPQVTSASQPLSDWIK